MVECFVTGTAPLTLLSTAAVLAFLPALLEVIKARIDDRSGMELVRPPPW